MSTYVETTTEGPTSQEKPRPTMVQPGLDDSRPWVFAALSTFVHVRRPGQIDRTRCGRLVRYIARPGDPRSWELCQVCQLELARESSGGER